MDELFKQGRQLGPIKRYDPDSPAFTMVPAGPPPPRPRAPSAQSERGKVEGKAEMLLTMLRQKFRGMSHVAEQQVRAASAAQLDAWAAAVLTATSLDELLAVAPRR